MNAYIGYDDKGFRFESILIKHKEDSIMLNTTTSTSNEPQACTRKYKGEITCDQMAWLKDDMRKAIHTAISIRANSLDNRVFEATIDGLVEGTLIEMLDIINVKPDYTNLHYFKF
jgi:hypothetical protein